MKTITVDDELYAFIASQTKHIGESASDILRRILIEELGMRKGDKTIIDVTKPGQVTKAVKEINKTKNLAASPDNKTPSQALHSVNSIESSKNTGELVDVGALFMLLNKAEFKQPMTKVERFLMMLSALYRTHPNRFNAVLAIKGKGRLYFAEDKNTLLTNGSSTNPKSIPESPYWVVTNNNTQKKCSMLLQAAEVLGFSNNNITRLKDLFNA
jgi:negative modulator of initiation of replication